MARVLSETAGLLDANAELRVVSDGAIPAREAFQAADKEPETSRQELQPSTGELTASNGRLHRALAGDVHCSTPVRPRDLRHAAGTTIFVVADDNRVLDTLGKTIREDGRTVELYGSARKFLAGLGARRSFCLVVDWRVADMDGIELLELLKAENRQIPAIVITGQGDVALAVRAMKAGAVGFIEKPIDATELLAAIDATLAQAANASELQVLRDATATRITTLTPRERQVMDLVVAGHLNKQIAFTLGVSQRTIENHRAMVMKKLGARTLSQLVHLALGAGAADSADAAGGKLASRAELPGNPPARSSIGPAGSLLSVAWTLPDRQRLAR